MKDERITYIDAMRGLAMVMVVVGHCCDGCFYYQPIYNTLINHALQIPLFFFISGFFVTQLTWRNILPVLTEKFRLLVLPAFLMLGLFCWAFDHNFIEALFMSMKKGYWFTMVLFGYIAIFLMVNRMAKASGLSAKSLAALHLVIALTVSYASLTMDRFDDSYSILSLLSAKEYFSYSYFVLGALMFRYRRSIFIYLNNSIIIGGGVLLAVILQIALTLYGTEWLGYGAGVTILVLRTVELTILWVLFYKYSALSTTSKPGRALTFIGRRTLDVYFIHYFFLPSHLQSWGEYFAGINAPLIAYLCAIILSIPLIVASLGMGCILRLSPFTAKLLLGSKGAQISQINLTND